MARSISSSDEYPANSIVRSYFGLNPVAIIKLYKINVNTSYNIYCLCYSFSCATYMIYVL